MTKRVAVYPGTFDPITLGHVDIIRRAAQICDKLIIAVAADTAKTPIFDLKKRENMVREDVKKLVKTACEIEVIAFDGLLVEFARKNKSSIIIRGLRAVSDFEYEFQMTGMNTKLDPEIQTVFLPASESTHFIASRFVKEIARLGGSIDELVSSDVAIELKHYFQ